MESQDMSGDGFGDVPEGQKLRYVVLHHTGSGEGDHFDLMMEVPGQEKLATWRVMLAPERWGGDVGAVRIGDHRKAYLSYEGQISGGRGMVKRVEEGTAEVMQLGDGWIEFTLTNPGRTVRLARAAG